MTEKRVPQLGEALDLIQSIEAHCELIERSGNSDVVAELRAIVRELRAHMIALADGNRGSHAG